MIARSLALSLLLAAAATPAHADEIFGGVYAHDVDSPLNLRGYGDGVDLQLGWRGERLRGLAAIGAPSPHAFVALNSAGDAHYAAAGISWKIGGQVYVRPGIGLAVHTAPSFDGPRPERSLGSRVLFAPELAVGVALGERASLEASLVHLSHATLLGRHNPGMDNIGLRLNYRF
ncbi:MAG TPA: acyloxyacyl hydrolase [Allosphingosinicella sp.]|nr:acyloxyacyl hydrolase [Allosphingosinicella sp.]